MLKFVPSGLDPLCTHIFFYFQSCFFTDVELRIMCVFACIYVHVYIYIYIYICACIYNRLSFVETHEIMSGFVMLYIK